MKPGESRYFLAIIPPAQIEQRICLLKQKAADKFNAKAALRSPAHITLHMPFIWHEAKEDRLINKLMQTTNYPPFYLSLNGFAAFAPRTIYIKNEYTQALTEFQLTLASFCRRELYLFNLTHNRGYNPHTTIAFRDLKKSVFPRAWAFFENQKFQETFKVDGFWLLKHDGKRWHAHKGFKFS